MDGANRLTKAGCLRGVSKQTLDALWQMGKTDKLKSGTILFHARSMPDRIYIQISGKSMIYNLTHSGKRKIIFIFGPGTLLNETVFNEHCVSAFCEMIENSEIFSVSVRQFGECMQRDFSLVRAAFCAQEHKIWRLTHQLKNTMGSIYMERKLASKLWKLARDFGVPKDGGIEIDIRMTITFLADLLGAPRETTSRLCHTLTGYGLMKFENHKITITDPHKMSVFYKEGIILK